VGTSTLVHYEQTVRLSWKGNWNVKRVAALAVGEFSAEGPVRVDHNFRGFRAGPSPLVSLFTST